MAENASVSAIRALIDTINGLWRSGNGQAIGDLVAADIVMAAPAMDMRIEGKPAFLAGFEDFTANARVVEYSEHDWRVKAQGSAGSAVYRFEMVYERDGKRWRSTGRDAWLCEQRDGRWLVIRRDMFDLDEKPAD